MASISAPPDYDLNHIAEQAGSTDPQARHYDGGVYHVSDVAQEQLESALAAYNPAALTPPRVVTRRRARRAMEQAGVLQAVEAYIATLDLASQIDYADASEFERSNPLIAQAQIALGWTDEALDNLFILAGSL